MITVVSIFLCFFFFQAEDGIRDGRVTGVQTCALPISIDFNKMPPAPASLQDIISTFEREHRAFVERIKKTPEAELNKSVKFFTGPKRDRKSRRVGKECKSRWATPRYKKNKMTKMMICK